MFKKIGYLVALAIIMVGYQNCSMESTHELNTNLSSKACDEVLKKTYQETYYSAFRQSCMGCHDAGGVAGTGRWFASSNFEEAYSYFKSLGRAKVEANAVSAAHKPPNTGSQHQAMVTAAQTKWAQAEIVTAQCTENSGMGSIDTIKKALPAAVYTGNPPADNAAWPRLSFNIMTDITNNNLKDKIGLTISMEVRRARVAGSTADVGYEFKNPRALIAGTPLPTWRIKVIKILKNDRLMSDFTTYDNLNFVAGPDPVSGLAVEQVMQVGSNGLMVTSPVAAGDQFTLRIGSIYDATGASVGGGNPGDPPPANLPARVSFAELTGGNNTLNVFTRSCVGCHAGATPAAGLNLTNYTQAQGLATTIQARMNNFNNPMPPSGVLGARDRDLVNIWVQVGTPQN